MTCFFSVRVIKWKKKNIWVMCECTLHVNNNHYTRNIDYMYIFFIRPMNISGLEILHGCEIVFFSWIFSCENIWVIKKSVSSFYNSSRFSLIRFGSLPFSVYTRISDFNIEIPGFGRFFQCRNIVISEMDCQIFKFYRCSEMF